MPHPPKYMRDAIDRANTDWRSLQVSRNPEKVSQGIREILKTLVGALGALRAGIYLVADDTGGDMRLMVQAGDAPPPDRFPPRFAKADLESVLGRLESQKHCVLVTASENRAVTSGGEIPLFCSDSSMVLLASAYAGNRQSSLVFLDFPPGAISPETGIDSVIQHMAQVFTNVVVHQQVLADYEEHLGFEKLLSDLSKRFINLSGEKIDAAIDTGLKQIADFFDIDRVTLFQVTPEHQTGIMTHFHSRVPPFSVGDLPEGLIVTAENFPYTYRFHRDGNIFYIASLDELPPEAEPDRASYIKWKTKSTFGIPLYVGGVLLGSINFNAIESEVIWPKAMIERGNFIGEIFAGALARKSAEAAVRKSYIEISELKNRLQTENIYFQKEIKLEHNFDQIIGESEAIKYVLMKIEQCAPTDATVILLGETGTGKELIARAIHDKSRRNNRPLIKVDCGALQSTLIERELFGHEKGAFTNAHQQQIGRFEIAHNGTLFLDEIGELPMELQPKLLRVIQDGEFERLGSPKTRKVDVRIIAATNRDLEKEVGEGRFRRDLWYRLNVFPVTIPPLRERREDIPLLVNGFVNKYAKKIGKKITHIPQKALDQLSRGHWAGNVRELENTIERAVIISQGERLALADAFECEPSPEIPGHAGMTLEDVEREHIRNVLKETGGRISGPKGAARILAINPSTLRFRMKKLGITKSSIGA